MNSILVFCAVAVFALAVNAAEKGDATAGANKMPEQLQAFLDGKLPPEKLTITYREVRGLRGELKIIVHGNGKVEQQLVRRKAPEPQNLNADAVRELVKLIVEQEAWKQKTPPAPSIPDEGRVSLQIVAGKTESTIWERVREMGANDRLQRISTLIEKHVWRPKAAK
ncbi:MAG: hypothetical protein SGJ20_20075 [Planctomycetota bacterium]|nr:hypothetical protein [Planctomycetota bacterium]